MTLERAGCSWLAASTAEAAAALRAASAHERDERIRGPDKLAASFVAGGPRLTALVKIPFVRRLAPQLAEWLLPGSYWYEIARVRHMDRVLCRELSAGARQLVILGAGFDTRAYRFADRLAGVATFEVDHPATAALKRARVRTVFGALPRHVRYVEADLHAGDLGGRLRAAGYSEKLRTHLIWSGVTPYLEAHGVDAVLGWLAARARSGSSIVFDYAFREAVEGDDAFYGARRLRRRLAEAGEPLLFGIPRGACARFLAERGLELVSNQSPEQLERRYLIRGDGRPAGRPYGFVAIAHARVPHVASDAA